MDRPSFEGGSLVRPRDRKLAQQLETGLLSFDREKRPLLGIRDSARREAFLEQILESIHRVKYVSVIRGRRLGECSADPNDESFDPLKAAILNQNQGHMDEAFWLVFLFVHFGKNARSGWRLAREVYGRLGGAVRWDWEKVSLDPSGFREWLGAHQGELRGGFGNHRKYQSLNAYSSVGTGSTVESYVKWVEPPRTHQELMERARERANGDPRKAFDLLYRSMRVVGFGRTARFDYLTMVGKLGLADIEPGSTYMSGSTGPATGARLLFADDPEAALKPRDLDKWIVELDAQLKVGMQVLEDSLCNWQKSPGEFKRFRG
jgi:hypothetical protein